MSMNLKEAFRLQNCLQSLISNVESFLYGDDLYTIKEIHMRKASNPAAEDEEIVRPKKMEYEANVLIELLAALVSEKDKLTTAISAAKKGADIDLDAALSMNKVKQDAISRLKLVAMQKPGESVGTGRGYLINAEGNQTAYNYDIKTVKTIDFDRNAVKGIISRLSKECEEVSNKADLLMLTLQVDYEPVYTVEDSFDDVYEKFRKK